MNIVVGHYECREQAEQRLGEPLPENVHAVGEHWDCWVEDDAHTWIIFLKPDGEPVVYLNREPGGGVIGDPVTRQPLAT